MQTINERMAVIESKLEENKSDNTLILAKLEAIETQINRYKGAAGFVWFAISCMGVFFSAWKFFHR